MSETFVQRSHMPVSVEALFAWHAAPGAFARLIPPGEPVEMVSPDIGLVEGGRVELRVGVGPLRLPWIAEVHDIVPGRGFRDVQLKGPFRSWRHEHRMEPDGPDGSWLEDRVTYELPLGPLGSLFGGPFVRAKLRRLFAFRHRVTTESLAAL